MKPSLLKVLKGHAGGVYTASLDSDNKRIYTGSADGLVGSWDFENMEPDRFSVKVGQAVYSVFLEKDRDRMLIGQAKGGIHVIDLATNKEIRHLQYHQAPVFRIREDSQSGMIFTLGGDGTISIIEAKDYKLLWSIPLSEDKLRCILVDQANGKLWVGGSDGFLRILENEYFNEIHSKLIHEGGIYAIMKLPDGRVVTGGRDGHLRFWRLDRDRLEALDAIPAHNYAIYDLALHPEGRIFASASRDKTVKIWSLDNIRKPIRIQRKGPIGHTHSVNVVGWLPDSNVLYSAGDDRDLHFWDL